MPRQRAESVADLGRQFARRHQNQGRVAARDAPGSGSQPLEQRQRERSRLAGAGLGRGQQVATFEYHRDGAMLDRGRLGIAELPTACLQLRAQREIIEQINTPQRPDRVKAALGMARSGREIDRPRLWHRLRWACRRGDRVPGDGHDGPLRDAEEPRRADRTAHSTNSGVKYTSLRPEAHIAPFRSRTMRSSTSSRRHDAAHQHQREGEIRMRTRCRDSRRSWSATVRCTRRSDCRAGRRSPERWRAGPRGESSLRCTGTTPQAPCTMNCIANAASASASGGRA